MKKIKTAIAASLMLVGINEITKESAAASTVGTATEIAMQQQGDVVGYVGNNFTDVDAYDSSNEAIYWAKQKGLISGFTDGSFRPNNSVTERQFAKILVNYFKLNSASNNLSNPSISETALHYNILAEYGIPLNGYNSIQLQNMPVKRGGVAQAIAYLANGSNNVEESIQYLLENNITTGQNQAYQNIDLHAYFGSENALTRKQVVTFFYRMNNANIVNISAVALDTYKANTPSQGVVSNPTYTTTQQGAVSNPTYTTTQQGAVSNPTYTTTQQGAVSNPTTTTSNQLISRDRAIAIAKQRVSGTVTKAELDYDNGVAVYDIDIHNGNTEYDIKVNARTGAIVKLETDYNNNRTQTVVSNPTTTPSQTVVSNPTTTTTSNQLISRDRAIAIAQQKFPGTVTKIELDYDYGIPVYEIEIRNGYNECDININARTGAILKFQPEYKYVPTQTTVSKPTTTTSNQLISRDKAISIAKQRVSGTVTKVELDYEYGTAVYEIEMRKGYMEYDIKINARTGAILKLESDYDD